MKFFAAVKLATFASELLGAAGFDLSALSEAGDVKALEAAISAKITASAKNAPDVEKVLLEAAQENEALTKQALAKSAALASLEKAVSAAGVKLPALAANAKPEEISAHESAITDAIKARASVLAQEQLAASGHPPISDVVIDPSKAAKNSKAGPTGLDRVHAAFASARN